MSARDSSLDASTAPSSSPARLGAPTAATPTSTGASKGIPSTTKGRISCSRISTAPVCAVGPSTPAMTTAYVSPSSREGHELLAACVPQGVVDLVEQSEGDDRDRTRALVDAVRGGLQEARPVEQGGERVAVGVAAQAGLQGGGLPPG